MSVPHIGLPRRSFLKRVWNSLPATLTDRLKVKYHNVRVGGRASFEKRGKLFQTNLNGIAFQTLDPPFWVLEEPVNRYELRHPLRRGEIVLDAGAYHGVFTLFFAAQVGHEGRVIALEPDDANRARCLENLNLNQQLRNVDVLDVVCWDQLCEIEFCDRGELGSSAMTKHADPSCLKRAATIDAIVAERQLPRVNFVKMNIEGAEIKALHGARHTIEKFRPDFAIEANHIVDGQPTYPTVERLLSQFGYEVETLWFGPVCITYGTVRK